MRQYEVYKHGSRKDILLLVVQSDLLDSLATRLVAPLIKEPNFGLPVTRLNPVLTVEDHPYVMDTANLAALSCSRLGEKVGSVESECTVILNAIDFLLCGF